MTTTARYPIDVVDTRQHPGSRVLRLVLEVDAPDVLLGVRRQLAADHAENLTAGTVVNIIDAGRDDTRRFDVRVWLPSENPPTPTLGV